MKKWLALLLAAMMALALVACGDTPANNDNDNKDNDTKTEEFARGSWDGNVYTNDSLNLTVTVPDGWKIATDEELAAIMGITIDSLTEQGVSEEFLKAHDGAGPHQWLQCHRHGGKSHCFCRRHLLR